MVKTISAISISKLGFTAKELRKLVEGEGGSVFIARISGVAAKLFSGNGKHGQWVGFEGDFIAANGKEDIFSSPIAFLPTNVSKGLKELIEQGQVEVPVNVDVYVEESEKSASGYRYICRPILSDESRQRMDKLKNAITKNLPQGKLALAAPEKTKKGA